MRRGLEIGFVYAGVVIGAGFASGKELWQFFGTYEKAGVFGLFAAFLLYLFLGYMVFYIIGEEDRIQSFSIANRFGFVMYFNTAFMFVLFSAMIAAAGSMSKEILGISKPIGSLVFCFFLYICIAKGKGGLVRASSVLTPLLIIMGIFCGLKACPLHKAFGLFSGLNISKNIFSALFSAFVYVSYNMLPLVAVMLPFKKDLRNGNVRLWGSFSGSFIMLALGICIFSPLVIYYNIIAEGMDIPMLIIIGKIRGGVLYGVYGAVLFAAVFTTAVGNYFGITASMCKEKQKILVLLAGFLCSMAGFSEIVDKIYPVFGILGLLNIVFIVYNYFRMYFCKNKSGF